MTTRLRTRPHLSASTESGNVSRPTINATMLVNDANWESDSAHSAFSIGKTALRTWRDM